MDNPDIETLRPEIENRLQNLFWTVSGDYTLNIKADVETFARSRDMALYDAIKQGAFARYFDPLALALYSLKKAAAGAEETLLLELTRLCADAAAYPAAAKERSGIGEIRRRAFRDALQEDNGTDSVSRLRQLVMRRFLGENPEIPQSLAPCVEEVEALASAPDTHTILAAVDSLYNRLADPDFPAKYGDLQKVLSMTEAELYDYTRYRELSDDQRKRVLEEYLEAVKQEMLRLKPKPPARRVKYVPIPQTIEEEPNPEDAQKVRAYMERSFGKSDLTPHQQAQLSQRLCRGLHRGCTLYFTGGILKNPALKSTQYLRNEMQLMKNEIYFQSKQLPIRRNVTVLADMLRRVQLMRLEESAARSDTGSLIPARLWKVGRTNDAKLFDEKKRGQNTAFVVDILIDGSSSQIVRQPQIAAQGYIISQALSQAGIPHRVSSFCSYWDYTILHRFRDYDDPPSENRNILQFHAFGENRDGLAIATVCDSLRQRTEENKILIVLSDGRPNHLGYTRRGCRKILPYVGEDGVKDTAFQVRKARNLGISVLGIFVGSEEDLLAERRIFGKEFTYTRKISSFSHIVGRYLRKQMET